VQKLDFYAPPAVAPPDETVMYPGTPKAAEEDLYVIATVNITDKLRIPIMPDGPGASMTTADGSSVDGEFLDGHDLPRLETEFPALTALASRADAPPIAIDETISPGATRTGTIVLLFPKVTQAMWQAKKSASLTINIDRQKPVTVTLP
jgi:hypothetical protein